MAERTGEAPGRCREINMQEGSSRTIQWPKRRDPEERHGNFLTMYGGVEDLKWAVAGLNNYIFRFQREDVLLIANRKYFLLIIAAFALGGCAASVKKGDNAAPIKVGTDASKMLVLNMTGSKDSTTSGDWEPFKGLWRQALKEDMAAIGTPFSAQEGEPRSTGEPGTLLVVDIADFRYLSTGMRYGFGVMTGNAFVNASVSFRDLKTGEVWGEQKYDTSSTAWQGIFSAMTDKQVRAICKEIIGNLAVH
jgi:hypothetical protein